MNIYKHLQPEWYYIDLHDKFMVDRLRLPESQSINLIMKNKIIKYLENNI